MLHTLDDLKNLAIHASDGDIGQTRDFYFDDKHWVIRYLVVETGSWLFSKKILLSPISIKELDQEDKTLSVSISREQVKNSPDIDTEKPVSRQYEVDYMGYYGYPDYWSSTGIWGSEPSPNMMASGYYSVAPTPDNLDNPDKFADVDAALSRDNDHHLRSSHAVTGYHLDAIDGELGHLQGMLIDIDTWAIRYLIINTSNWWSGHLVLIAPKWIKEVSWPTSKIYVDMTQQQVKDAPTFDPSMPFNLEHEQSLQTHYGRNDE
ncbi:PRC-barrel domain-containing protein [Shewanella baltica]|uniref:PRC-barrel domain-containing protein n=1 Tax=Shewanella baltica TaxID=62322 RepID=UPI00217CC3F2|nr:PRC-barrel domain-containing protein [Shewanella baltica]MCS6096884.1 PRC-barrel domain containing protein [Shewanella baltica]MCS6227992.1 PRC-barrel domain containing protein [Shewanella baltica]